MQLCPHATIHRVQVTLAFKIPWQNPQLLKLQDACSSQVWRLGEGDHISQSRICQTDLPLAWTYRPRDLAAVPVKKKKAPLLRWWLGHFWSNCYSRIACGHTWARSACLQEAGWHYGGNAEEKWLLVTNSQAGAARARAAGRGLCPDAHCTSSPGVQQPHFCTAVRGSGCPLVTCWQAVQDPLFQHGFSSWLNSFWSCRSADPASS